MQTELLLSSSFNSELRRKCTRHQKTTRSGNFVHMFFLFWVTSHCSRPSWWTRIVDPMIDQFIEITAATSHGTIKTGTLKRKCLNKCITLYNSTPAQSEHNHHLIAPNVQQILDFIPPSHSIKIIKKRHHRFRKKNCQFDQTTLNLLESLSLPGTNFPNSGDWWNRGATCALATKYQGRTASKNHGESPQKRQMFTNFRSDFLFFFAPSFHEGLRLYNSGWRWTYPSCRQPLNQQFGRSNTQFWRENAEQRDGIDFFYKTMAKSSDSMRYEACFRRCFHEKWNSSPKLFRLFNGQQLQSDVQDSQVHQKPLSNWNDADLKNNCFLSRINSLICVLSFWIFL